MAVEFTPTGLETLLSSANTYGISGTSKQTNEEILEDLGIPVTNGQTDMGLEFEDYLQLMVQQLQNQTMDNTMDTSAMLDQLVQMSTVQTMAALQTSMAAVADGVALNYAASLVGKTVTVGKVDDEGNLEEIVGTVTGTGIYQGSQVIFVDGEMYSLNSIMAVGTLPELPEEPEEPGEGEGEGEGGTGTGGSDGEDQTTQAV